MGKPASFDNTSFRYGTDGTETGHGWVYAADTNGDLDVDVIYLMRVVVAEGANVAASGVTIQWEYNLNAAGWNSVTTTAAPIQAVGSANLTNGEDCTQRLGSGTFITTNAGVTEDGTSGAVSFAGNDEMEALLVFQIPAAEVVDADTIQLRCTVVGESNSYTTIPSITVNEAGTLHNIAGLVEGASTVTITDSLNVQHAIAPAVDATSTVSITLTVEHGIAGTVAATGDVQVVLQSTTQHAIAAQVDATADVQAIVTQDHAIAPAVDAVSDVQIVLQSSTEHAIAAAIDATSTVDIAVSVTHALAPVIDAVSDMLAILSHEHGIIAQVDATSDIQSIVTQDHAINPLVDGSSDMQVVLTTTGVKSLIVAIDATSAVDIVVSVEHPMAMVVNASSDMQAALSHEHGLAPTVNAVSDMQIAIDHEHGLAPVIDGVSTVEVAGIAVDHDLVVAIDSVAIVGGVVTVSGAIDPGVTIVYPADLMEVRYNLGDIRQEYMIQDYRLNTLYDNAGGDVVLTTYYAAREIIAGLLTNAIRYEDMYDTMDDAVADMEVVMAEYAKEAGIHGMKITASELDHDIDYEES